jgi:hypothetical protein
VDLAVSRKSGNVNDDADALKLVRTLSGAKALDTQPDLSGEKVGTRLIASVGRKVCQIPHGEIHGLVAGLHRNSENLERRATLDS